MNGRPCLGMHWPNHPHRKHDELMRFLGDSAPVTILHMQAAERYQLLRESGPDRLIHVRIYREWWEQESPEALARWAARELAYLWHDPRVLVSPANEQNIELVGVGPGWIDTLGAAWRKALYAKIGKWNLDFWRELDRLVPDRKALALWSALADGHDAEPGVPDSEYQVPEIREACEYVDVLASHPYGKLSQGPHTLPGGPDAFWHMLRPWRPAGTGRPRDPGGILAQFPGKPHFVSETGTFVHDRREHAAATANALRMLAFRASGDGVTLGVTPFIWDSDPQHSLNIIAGNDALVGRLLALPRATTTAPLPIARTRSVPPPRVPTPAPGAVTPLASGYRPHVVRRGETLYSLAGRRWKEIRVTVPLEDARQLEVGAVVMIPDDIRS